MSKTLLITTVLLGAAAVAAPAFAFTYESAPTNADGSAKFTDPDSLADGLADGLTGGDSSGSTAGFLHMFGTSSTTAGVGMARSNVGVVTPQGTLQRPYDRNDPTTHP